MVWDVEAQQRVLTLEGHEATVCCIAVDSYKIVSGAADTKIHIWDIASGALLRLLHGHAKSVNCLHIGPTWMVSGGADAEVRVWDLEDGTESKSKFRKVRCRKRLRDLEREIAITVCKYGKLEVLTGSADGVITVVAQVGAVPSGARRTKAWSTTCSSTPRRVAEARRQHRRDRHPTGSPCKPARAHEATLAVPFDPRDHLTARTTRCATGTGARWARGERRGQVPHVRPGRQPRKIAQKYHTTVPNLVQWNAIVDVRKLYLGQKLIVQKGNPDEPTEAEKAAEERAAKAKAKAAKIEGNTGSRGPSDAKAEAALKAAAGDDGDGGPGSLKVQMGKKSLRELGYSAPRDPSSYVARVDAAMDKTLLDVDRHDEVSQLDRNWYNKKSLTARLKVAVLGMVDPFAEDAEQQMKALEEVKPKKKKANDDDDSDEEVDENITSEEEQAAKAAASLQERLVAMVEDFVVRAVVADEARDIAWECSRKPVWHDSLAGRLTDFIIEGPFDNELDPLGLIDDALDRFVGRGATARPARRSRAQRFAAPRRRPADGGSAVTYAGVRASRPRARPRPRPTATRTTRKCSRASRTTARRSSRTRTSRRPRPRRRTLSSRRRSARTRSAPRCGARRLRRRSAASSATRCSARRRSRTRSRRSRSSASASPRLPSGARARSCRPSCTVGASEYQPCRRRPSRTPSASTRGRQSSIPLRSFDSSRASGREMREERTRASTRGGGRASAAGSPGRPGDGSAPPSGVQACPDEFEPGRALDQAVAGPVPSSRSSGRCRAARKLGEVQHAVAPASCCANRR